MPGLRALALLAAAASASAKGGSSSGSGSGSGSVAPGSAPPPPGEVWTLHDKQDFVRAVKSADVLFVNFFFAVGCHFSDELQPEWDAAAKLLAEAGVDATMARVDIQKSTRLKNMCGAFDAAVPMIKLFTPEEGRNSVATFQRLDESADSMLGVNSPILHEPQIPQRCPTPGGKTERIPHVTPKHEWGPGFTWDRRDLALFITEYVKRRAAGEKEPNLQDLVNVVIARPRGEDEVIMDSGRANSTLCRGSGMALEPGTGDETHWKCEEGNPGEQEGNPRGWCIPAMNRCNGFENCLGDGSDELDCYTEEALEAMPRSELVALAAKTVAGARGSSIDVDQLDTDELVDVVLDGVSAEEPDSLAATVMMLTDEDTLPLLDGRLETTIAAVDRLMVEFYAPWCKHCQELKPQYDKAARALGGTVLAAVDVTANPAAAKKYGVTSMPTIKWFEGGQLVGDYDGARSANDIREYVVSRGGAGSVVVPPPERKGKGGQDGTVSLTRRTFDKMLEKHKDTGLFVEFYAPWCGHCKHLAPVFEEVVTTLADGASSGGPVAAKVDATVQRKLAKRYEIDGYPYLKLFIGDEVVDFPDTVSVDKAGPIVDWVKGRALDPDYTGIAVDLGALGGGDGDDEDDEDDMHLHEEL